MLETYVDDDTYFPINVDQVRDILGKVLTQIEAMNLRESAEKANKDIARQTVWKWFEGVQENSKTAAIAQLRPFAVRREADGHLWWHGPDVKGGKIAINLDEQIKQQSDKQ